MESPSLPMLAASRFLSPPPLPRHSRRSLPCVRAGPDILEAPEALKPLRPSPRRSAVAEVQVSPDLVAALNRFKDVLQTQDCNIILRHCGNTRRWDDLSKVFKWMQEHEMTNTASYSSYFKYLGLGRNPSRALQVYGAVQDRSMKVHVSVCNSILGCLVKNGRLDSSFKLYDEMIREVAIRLHEVQAGLH
ncbi:hypothetical protein ACP4OV_011420 [Aristida adscensionis]